MSVSEHPMSSPNHVSKWFPKILQEGSQLIYYALINSHLPTAILSSPGDCRREEHKKIQQILFHPKLIQLRRQPGQLTIDRGIQQLLPCSQSIKSRRLSGEWKIEKQYFLPSKPFHLRQETPRRQAFTANILHIKHAQIPGNHCVHLSRLQP